MRVQCSVFTAGSNSHGQCGRPIVDNEDSGLAAHNVHRVCMDGVPLFDKEYVKSVGAGLDHSLVLTSGGRVFACGLGADMQTGSRSGISVQPQLTAVTGDIDKVHIIQVSCTADSVLALDNHGQVRACCIVLALRRCTVGATMNVINYCQLVIRASVCPRIWRISHKRRARTVKLSRCVHVPCEHCRFTSTVCRWHAAAVHL
jgi:hypothetical protein